MQAISFCLTLTRGIAARLIIRGPRLAGESVMGVIYPLLGYSVFLWIEPQAKRAGRWNLSDRVRGRTWARVPAAAAATSN